MPRTQQFKRQPTAAFIKQTHAGGPRSLFPGGRFSKPAAHETYRTTIKFSDARSSQLDKASAIQYVMKAQLNKSHDQSTAQLQSQPTACRHEFVDRQSRRDPGSYPPTRWHPLPIGRGNQSNNKHKRSRGQSGNYLCRAKPLRVWSPSPG